MKRTSRTVAAVLVAAATVLAALLLGATGSAGADPYEPTGRSVAGGTDAGTAIALDPGTYRDTLARGSASAVDGGSSRYYAISVRRGETAYVAATLPAPTRPAADSSLGLEITLTARGEDTYCEQQYNTDTASSGLSGLTVSIGSGTIGSEDACPAGTLIVRVTRSGDAGQSQPLGVDLVYRLEPAAGPAGLPQPAGSAQPSLQPRVTGPGAELRSARSYADAPLLADGVYRDTIGSDDVRIVRVHLDWGQRFAYELNFGGRGAEFADTVDVYATVRNPVREPVDSEQSAFGVGGDDASVSGATPVPVRYRNRESDDEDTAECDIAGDYYLVLRSDPADSGTSVRYSYSLRVQVFGKASGAPAYGAAGGSSSSGSSAGTTTPTSANTSSARTTPSGPVDAAGSGSDRTLVVAIVAGGAALLVVIVLVAVLGRRRRHG